MVASLIGTDSPCSPHFIGLGPAAVMEPAQRRALSLAMLSGDEPVSELARSRGVSRQFCYRQAGKARQAIDRAFEPAAEEDQKVLFDLPVTKPWLKQVVLTLVLTCHSSYRGVMEFLDAVFDYRDISLGTIHNIIAHAMAQAKTINDNQDLSNVRVGAHDEIFQAGRPVLVGVDVASTYCYLLNVESHRDETTWGVNLLELQRQGLHPDYTVADGGGGLRAGQAAAWPNTPCHGDVFHAERELKKLAFFLGNRAKGCLRAREKLESKMRRSKKRGRGRTISKRLAIARQAETKAVRLAEDISTLSEWMQQDILALAGPELSTRRELFDYIIEQLNQYESWCPHRISPVRRALENQRDDLLAFVGVLDERLDDIAAHFDMPACLVHKVCELQGLDQNKAAYWQRREALYQQLGDALHGVEAAVKQAMADTPRASSIVENINSRLRNYFFLRRQLGGHYLHLLRFFLNHRPFRRSDRPERVGKSPAQLLTGQPHRHWLELLGHQRFARN